MLSNFNWAFTAAWQISHWFRSTFFRAAVTTLLLSPGPHPASPSPPLPTPVQPSADDLPPTSQTVGRRGCIEHKFLHLLFLLPHSLSFLLGQLLPTLHHSAPSFHSLQASLSFIPVLFAFPSAFNRVALFPHLPTLFFHFWEKNIKSPSYKLRNLCLKHLPKFVVYCLFIFNSDHFWFLCSEWEQLGKRDFLFPYLITLRDKMK